MNFSKVKAAGDSRRGSFSSHMDGQSSTGSERGSFDGDGNRAQFSDCKLRVIILEGRSLVENGRKPDTYVSVAVDAAKTRTNTVKASRHPQWNEEKEMDLRDVNLTSGYMEVTVWNWEYFGNDEPVGQVFILLNSLDDGKVRELWYPLLQKGHQRRASSGNRQPTSDAPEIRLRLQLVRLDSERPTRGEALAFGASEEPRSRTPLRDGFGQGDNIPNMTSNTGLSGGAPSLEGKIDLLDRRSPPEKERFGYEPQGERGVSNGPVFRGPASDTSRSTASRQKNPPPAHRPSHVTGGYHRHEADEPNKGKTFVHDELSPGKMDYTRAFKSSIPHIIKTMRDHPHIPSVQLQALFALRNLAAVEDARLDIIREGIADLVLGALREHMTDAELVEEACRTLGCFAIDDEVAMAAGRPGVGLVMEAMQAHPTHVSVQLEACFALENLSINNGAIEEICRGSTIPLILKGMRDHIHAADFQEQACRLLGVLSCVESCRDAIIRESGAGAVLQSMDAHSSEARVNEEACRTLGTLALNATGPWSRTVRHRGTSFTVNHSPVRREPPDPSSPLVLENDREPDLSLANLAHRDYPLDYQPQRESERAGHRPNKNPPPLPPPRDSRW